MINRRDFLKGSAAAGALIACGGVPKHSTPPLPTFSDPDLVRLADLALGAARDAGATYADIRIEERHSQAIFTREARVEGISDSQDRGFGVRVIAAGAWGFAASASVTPEEVVRVAKRAVEIAKRGAKLRTEPIVQAPAPAVRAIWNAPVEKDAFAVPIDEKVATLLGANAAALAVSGVQFVSSYLFLVKEHKFYASSDGSYVEQTRQRSQPGLSVTAVDAKQGRFEERGSLFAPRGLGYEYVEQLPWNDEATQAASDAVAKLSAPSVDPATRDLVLDPTHLWLTIHESVGHSTELDRAMGLEANFAGTSFLTPDKRGTFMFGSEHVTIHGERVSPGGLATVGYDDDGVASSEWALIDQGKFVDYQTTRDQAAWIGETASHGAAYADSWGSVAIQRMSNVNLMPAASAVSLDDLIGGVDDGIYIKGNGSWSIDHQRFNFQFGGQVFYEIKGGKLGRMLADVAYQSKTPDFWGACDGVGGAETVWQGGSFTCGKGEPEQVSPCTHACPPARFRGINIINTKRSV